MTSIKCQLINETFRKVKQAIVSVQQGLFERTGSDSDRRCQLICLTNSARQLEPQLAQLADNNDDYFFGVLTNDEQQQLKQLLEKLRTQHQLLTRPVD